MNDAAISGNTTVNNTYITNNYDTQSPSVDTKGMSRDERIDAFVDYALSEDGPGAEAGAKAFGMAYGQEFADATKEYINGLDMPQAQKDVVTDLIDHQLDANQLDTTGEVMDLLDIAKEFMGKMAKEDLEDGVKEASGGGAEGAENNAKGGNGGAGNWLVQLAKAMSKVASNHLEKMIAASNEIGAMGEEGAGGEPKLVGDTKGMSKEQATAATEDAKAVNTKVNSENAARMTQLTAEMQAHTQLFKMVQEATTTTIKTTGEALNGSVRKQ